jgi:hypothetical protein
VVGASDTSSLEKQLKAEASSSQASQSGAGASAITTANESTGATKAVIGPVANSDRSFDIRV